MIKKLLTAICILVLMRGYAQESRDSLDIMIGQMIMVGIADYYEPIEREAINQLIKDGKVGGIILFEKNLTKESTLSDLARMTADLHASASIPLFMGIDEEGGRVNRLKPKYGFPRSVSAQYLGELDNPDSTTYYGRTTAENLKKYGFNINYAPTVDVNLNPDNPVIGKAGRSYSSDYRQVIRHADLFMEAHRDLQIATVLKHFPGHGSSEADTHNGVADVSSTWQFEELYPYAELMKAGKVDAVMSAHIVNRTLDERMLPGTLSDKIISGILRQHLGFEGVVFSDDMHMGAIVKYYGTEEAVTLAIKADLDVLMFSNNIYDDERITADDLHRMIRSKVETGEISEETIRTSYNRIIVLKEKLGLMEEGYKKELQKRLKTLY